MAKEEWEQEKEQYGRSDWILAEKVREFDKG
jgi:hypothetical protein